MTTIRTAQRSDAKTLAELAEATFRDAFSAMNTDEDMNLHCASNYSETIQTAEIANPEYVTLVAEDAGNLVAYAQVRWGTSPACVSATFPGEIQRLYVEKSWHGKGLAQELMAACIAQVQARNSDSVWLGVWEKNPRAIAFYRKFNFTEVGEHTFSLGNDLQRDIIMTRQI